MGTTRQTVHNSGFVRTLSEFEQLDVDVTTSGQSDTFDAMGVSEAVWLAEMTALAGGGTVTFTWQHSPDNSNWYDIASESALSAAGFKQRQDQENLFRFRRVAWATTGTITTATASFFIQSP
jgi:hypothetical protein